jgi:N,N-dimethylformamidase
MSQKGAQDENAYCKRRHRIMIRELTGYTDPLTAASGTKLRFMISTDAAQYAAKIVRLIHGDENPKGPGFKSVQVDASVNGRYPGRKQIARSGSYVRIESRAEFSGLRSLTLQAWIYPTTPKRQQGLITKWSEENKRGYALVIESDGTLAFWIGDVEGNVRKIRSAIPLRERQWYFVAASYDERIHRACLYQSEQVELALLERGAPASTDEPWILGAMSAMAGFYNGRIDGPKIFARVLDDSEIGGLRRGAAPAEIGGDQLVANWDFSADILSARVSDLSKHKLNGMSVNGPARAVPGHNWTGNECDFRHVPHEYGAIHFHEDDLDDARWLPDFEWQIPADLKSGIYAAHITAGELEDYIPFFVRPGQHSSKAPVAFLVPSLTYMAYANERLQHTVDLGQPGVIGRTIQPDPTDAYLAEHPELGLSVYDNHADGSGSFYSTRLRPILNMRPKYRMWLLGAPRGLSADLYLVDWLETKQFSYDIITDEDLHRDGVALLRPYRAVITGSHPEYYTNAMLTALGDHVDSGGRLMYLGGNGFYWVTSVDLERPHVIELRRGVGGSGPYKGEPGEGHHSTTAEPGGIWRHRGRAPNKLVGVGFSSMGWETTSYGYHRQPGSFDPRAQFVFEGIGDHEVIGEFGLVMDGAVGDELDRLDYQLGTPPDAILLASSRNHSAYYQPVIEDLTQITPSLGAGHNPNVRADMVLLETANGGAVFSVGSISWFGSLSHNDYSNNVSKVTENVLRKFIK